MAMVMDPQPAPLSISTLVTLQSLVVKKELQDSSNGLRVLRIPSSTVSAPTTSRFVTP
jgi:hypothetical protein